LILTAENAEDAEGLLAYSRALGGEGFLAPCSRALLKRHGETG